MGVRWRDRAEQKGSHENIMKQLTIAMLLTVATLRLYGADPKQTKVRDTSLMCLAETIYFESGNQSETGMVAVGFVVLNRAEHDSSKVCKVVHARTPGTGRCQFDWYCSQSLRRSKKNVNWPKCLEVAQGVLNGEYEDPTHGAIAFHSGSLKPRKRPSWAKRMKRTLTAGNVFYAPRTPHSDHGGSH